MLEHDKRVHGADLSDIMLRAVQPEVLHVALGSSSFLRGHAGRVVRAKLVRTDTCHNDVSYAGSHGGLVVLTSWRSAHKLSRAIQRDRLEALWVIWSDRAANDE